MRSGGGDPHDLRKSEVNKGFKVLRRCSYHTLVRGRVLLLEPLDRVDLVG